MNAMHWATRRRPFARENRFAMRRPTLCLTARLLLAGASLSFAATAPAVAAALPQRVATLYLSVLSMAQSQPAHRPLIRQCQTRIAQDHYVTFLGVRNNRSLIVAFSRQPLSDPSRDIALAPLFVMKGGLLQPRAYDPRARTPTIDWGYIFDTNGDGRVDYLAYLESASPVAPEGSSANLPPLLGTITGKAYKLGMRHTRLVFWQAIDTDFSGRSDLLLAPMKDRRTGWVDSTLLLTGVNRKGEHPHCVWFQGNPGKAMYACQSAGNGFSVAGKQVLGFRTVPPRVDFITRVNVAARQCRLGANSFYTTPQQARHDLAGAH